MEITTRQKIQAKFPAFLTDKKTFATFQIGTIKIFFFFQVPPIWNIFPK